MNPKSVVKLLTGYIQNKKVQKIETILNGIPEGIGIQSDLICDAHLFCGDFYVGKENFEEAIKHFSKAHAINSSSIPITNKYISAIIQFHDQNESSFSSYHIPDLLNAVKFLLHSIEYNINNNSEVTQPLIRLINRLEVEKYTIGDKSYFYPTVTHQTKSVCKYLTEPKTYQEVLENFAFMAEDDLRLFYEKELEQSVEIPVSSKMSTLDNNGSTKFE